MALIQLDDIHFAYPGQPPVLSGASMQLGAGERLSITGANGAGKSTLLRLILGLQRPDTGTVTVFDHPRSREKEFHEVRRRIGLVFQDPDDQLFMPTVRDDVAFGPANLGLRGDDLDRRVHEALTAVGMDDVADRAPHHLSFGQRRRVAVATVLAMQPDVLVLDEPSSNLDPASRRELADILLGLDQTILLVTHDLPYALELCPRSVVMNEGTIVADGTTPDILGDRSLMESNRLELPYGFDPRNIEPRKRPR